MQLTRPACQKDKEQDGLRKTAYTGHHSPVHVLQFSAFWLHQSFGSEQLRQAPQQHFPVAGAGAGGSGGAPSLVVNLQFEMYAGFMLQCSGPEPQSSPSIQFMSRANQY